MKRILLTSFLIATAAIVFLLVRSEPLATAAAKPRNLDRVTLRVDGMTCASCKATVKIALKHVKGVADAEVSLEKKEAVVSFNKKEATIDELVAAVKRAGYQAAPQKSKEKKEAPEDK